MVACGGSARHLNIVAYFLSDMGWGPVIDSTIAVAVEQATATIEVAVQEALEGFDKAIADNLLVSIDLPDGVLVEAASTAPADCDLGQRRSPVVSPPWIVLPVLRSPWVACRACMRSRWMWITRHRTWIRSR